MKPYYADDLVTLHHGRCEEVLRELADASVDAVVTDPPYELGFMGKGWDATGIAYNVDLWREALRVLKPGGHLLAFGGSRTWHRLASAVEDAGFEIRDSIAWLYGSGFPKSLDVSKAIDKAAGAVRPTYERPAFGGTFSDDNGTTYGQAIDATPITEPAAQWQGWGTALKPAFEPIVVGRKPLTGTVAANVLEHGTGALNIDACRIEGDEDGSRNRPPSRLGSASTYAQDEWTRTAVVKRQDTTGKGRWPTNVVLDESQATELDKQTGYTVSNVRTPTGKDTRGVPNTESQMVMRVQDTTVRGVADSGGASRFFPTFHYEAKAPTTERPRNGETAHPTVKPLDLMRWLVRLVTPPGGTVLEPFAGSGTTAEACVIEGFRCIAIEREADYLPLIIQRLTKPIQPALDFGEVPA